MAHKISKPSYTKTPSNKKSKMGRVGKGGGLKHGMGMKAPKKFLTQY